MNPAGKAAEPQASGRRLLNATAVMASGTLVSRILGFVKASLLVIVLGASGPQPDAYSLALLVPNSLYMIFAGGALNTVLVPQIVRHIKNDDDDGEAFVNRVVTAFLVVLAPVTVLAMIFAPQIIGLWTNESWDAPAMAPHWQQLALLGLLTMPQLFFYGAFFLIAQVLNARDKFGPMMWAPIVNNIVSIAVLGAYAWIWGTNAASNVPFTNEQVYLLGIGSTLGIVLQTAALIPAMRSIGFRYRPRFDLRGQGLGETFHLAKWMLGNVLLTTVAQAIMQNLASGASTGEQAGAGVTAYNTAYLVWILPHSLLTVSLATAMLPSASRLAAAHDMPGVAAETMRTMRLANTFLLPSAVGFMVLGYPFTSLAFGHGRASNDWTFIALTLVAFAVGLVPYTIQYVYLRGYFALEDTRTPFFLQVLISGLSVVLGVAMIALDPNPLTVAPRLALAYAGSYYVGAIATHYALKRRLPGLSGGELLRHLVQLTVAVLPGAALAWGITWWFERYPSKLMTGLGFALAALVAIIAFFFVAKRLGIAEASQLMSVLRRRRPTPVEPEAAEGASDALLPAATSVPTPSEVYRDKPLLCYPDPDAPHTPRTEVPEGAEEVAPVRAGQVLGNRYRLDEILARRGGTLTWRGFDQLLGRAVLIHVMSPAENRALSILDQARLAAPAVDSRFLRVWDAVLVEDASSGSFIVCEYAPGLSLEMLISHTGALVPLEAAWMVREIADGLIAMHAQGLYHRQLNPDTVIVSASGNIKIVGFLVEAALYPEPDDATDGEAQDVYALGELLYAALVGRWPGSDDYSMDAAPLGLDGTPKLPRQVRAGIPGDLDAIVDRIFNPTPRGGASRLTTAADVAAALNAFLGGADASHSLEKRLQFPAVPITFRNPAAAATSAIPAVVAAPAPASDGGWEELDEDDGPPTIANGDRPYRGESTMPFTPVPPPAREGDSPSEDMEPTQRSVPALPPPPASSFDTPPLAALPGAGPISGSSTASDAGPDASPDATGPGDATVSPARPALVASPAPMRRPRAIWWLLAAFLIVLLISLVAVFVNEYHRTRPAAAPASPPLRIAAVRDFDPKGDGGDNKENPALAARVLDGDPSTAWTTEKYGKSAKFNGRKPGVGLVIDLGKPTVVGSVTLDVGDVGPVAELRVPEDETATTPPLKSAKQWRTVAPIAAGSGTVTTKLDQPVTTRFVLVYLTSLPNRGSYYEGSIASVDVQGP